MPLDPLLNPGGHLTLSFRLQCCLPSCQLPDLMSPILNLRDHANALVRTLEGASCFREETLLCQVAKPI